MDFATAVKTCFSKYASFEGRAIRSEYWFFILATFIVSVIIQALAAATGSGLVALLGTLWSLAVFLPSLAAMVRRLHDVDRSGWWWLIALTGIGAIVLIVWLAQAGTPGPNRFGPQAYGTQAMGVQTV